MAKLRFTLENSFTTAMAMFVCFHGCLVPHRLSAEESEEVTINLEYSDDLLAWGISYHRPTHFDLSAKVPTDNWVLPKPRGNQRLFGQWYFGETRVKAVVDELDTPYGAMVFAFDDDQHFDNKPTITRSKQSINFTVKYSDGKTEPYAIRAYYPVEFAKRIGKHRLHYYRACLRQGKAVVSGKEYRLAILDENADGKYSDLADTRLLIDLDGNGRIETEERFPATAPVALASDFYRVAKISDAGDKLSLKPSRLGSITGIVSAASTGQPVPNAKLVLHPLALQTVADEQGQFSIEAPEGNYYRLTATANGMVPEHFLLRGKPVTPNEAVEVLLQLESAVKKRSGRLRLKDKDSFHFLAGQRYSVTKGDFYLSFSSGEPLFWANNAFQRGVANLQDLGDTPLEKVKPPKRGYSRFRVPAVVGNTYVALAKEGEQGCHIVFRVLEVQNNSIEIEYFYRNGTERASG